MQLKIYSRLLAIVAATVMSWSATAQVLTLDECLKKALENNKKLKAAQYQVDAAKAASDAATLNNRPSIDGSVMGIYLGNPLDKLLPAVQGSASVTITQPLYAGGKIKLGKEAAEKVVELYQDQKVLTETEVHLAVETAWWQIVRMKAQVTLADKYIELLRGLQKDLKNSYEAGLSYKNDLLRVEVNLNESELNKTKANDGLLMSKLQLAQLIGATGVAGFDIADSIMNEVGGIPQYSLDSIAVRPEITVLQKGIEVETIQTKLIKAQMKPTLGASLSALGAGGKQINFTNGKDLLFTHYGLISLSVPLFDWGKNSKKVKEQSLKIKAQETRLEETKELIALEVQQALLALNQSVKNIHLSSLSLQQAEENLRLANDRFKAGTIVAKDVQEAQAIWQQASTNIINAKVEYMINKARYKKATGRLS